MIKYAMLFGFLMMLAQTIFAQATKDSALSLSAQERSIVVISAFEAQGNIPKLSIALNTGLDAGLTISEIKEVLVQLYAYTGFPRSLNALQTFLAVLKERKQKGINDNAGKDASPLPTNVSKLQFGTEMQTKLVGQPVKGEIYAFAPAIDQFLKEHLFGDIFGRDNLNWKTRELATIAALAALGGAENQLRSHFGVGRYNGLSAAQLQELVTIIENHVGLKEGSAAASVLQSVLGTTSNRRTRADKGEEIIDEAIFPRGEQITNDNFVGNAWLNQLVTAGNSNNIQVGNVTFAPGGRTKWHSHPAGQILLVTQGTGYYQEKGQPKKILRKGDVINCPGNIVHWHGASANSWFVQLAVTSNQKGAAVWHEGVNEAEYNK